LPSVSRKRLPEPFSFSKARPQKFFFRMSLSLGRRSYAMPIRPIVARWAEETASATAAAIRETSLSPSSIAWRTSARQAFVSGWDS